jgi:3-phenylpropionate/cinnamic acid dioxygenase small subunit
MIDTEVRAEIGDLNARFAWALDSHDWSVLREVLSRDVHYVSVGREFHDAESVIESFRARDEGRTTRHGLGNLLLHTDTPDTVVGRGTWHTFASNDRTTRGVPLYMVADFHDTYRRDEHGTWRIAERVIVPVFRDDLLAPPPAPGASR